jgi:hypothetical protein
VRTWNPKGDASLSFLFNFASGYAIKKVHENQEGLKKKHWIWSF